ncbi:TIGR04290 family methyltransferase [Pelagibacterium sp. 26DY04]|uniref:TIGR04290 family methyltransferase n=1 Tax=Pelagibacterium sp. 26DY04 TaxID=2967130 RepID=UPI002814B395|nr:TIGR04290 family methyltransferase [Pelagibacterium sp. 26DY04]WMT86144.1 TIGR04290 family methyltransferase [Pelagibacterium sp. 26DY04]
MNKAFDEIPSARHDLARRIDELAPWFHNIEIAGIQTAPGHMLGNHPRDKWNQFQHILPDDLEGRSVLDIGCNAGFFSLEMKRRGAGRIVAIDSDPRYVAQAELVFDAFNLDADLRQLSVYDLASLGERFDLVLFMGVFYHLRHPLLALDLIHEHVADDLMLFQTLQRGDPTQLAIPMDMAFSLTDPFDNPAFPRFSFIENRYAEDPTNWFIPNRSGSEAALRSSGFAIEAHADPDVYLCRKVDRPQWVEPPPAIAV